MKILFYEDKEFILLKMPGELMVSDDSEDAICFANYNEVQTKVWIDKKNVIEGRENIGCCGRSEYYLLKNEVDKNPNFFIIEEKSSEY